MNDVAKRGIGCGVLCLLFVVGILALPSEKFAAIMAWAILFSIPMGIARFFFKDLFEDYGWWIWGTMWATSVVLGLTVKLDSPNKPGGRKTRPPWNPAKGWTAVASRFRRMRKYLRSKRPWPNWTRLWDWTP